MKSSLFIYSCLPLTAYALTFPVRQLKRPSFAKRDAFGHKIQLNDSMDVIYMADVQIEGSQFLVQLDTGSSDLWVTSGSTVLGTNTGLSTNISYGLGYAAGSIARAKVSFAGFDVPSQAYLEATQVNNPVTEYGAVGVLGVSFTSLSTIDSEVTGAGQDWGKSLLYNIFAQNTTTPNSMSVALQRTTDPGEDVQGEFAIGEYDSRYAGIANTAPIPTFPQHNPSRWNVVVDSLIINGKKVQLTSTVKGAPIGKAVALLDTGTTAVYAPENIVTEMYSGISGANFDKVSGSWIVPCDAEVDVSVVIGGRQFDLHPLDTVQSSSSGSSCSGTWMPQDLSVGASEFDMLFGDGVLRSMYTVYDFGDFDSNGKMGDPYVRLWSLVTGSDASNEFRKVRGGQGASKFTDSGDANAASPNANTLSSSPNSNSSSPDIGDLQSKVDKIMKWAPVALGVAALNVVLLFIALIVMLVTCCRRRKNDRPSGSFIPLPLAGSSAAAQYRPVSLQGNAREDGSIPYDTGKYGAAPRYND